MENTKPASKQQLLNSTSKLLCAIRKVASQDAKIAPQETKILKGYNKNQILYFSGSVLTIGDLISTSLKSKSDLLRQHLAQNQNILEEDRRVYNSKKRIVQDLNQKLDQHKSEFKNEKHKLTEQLNSAQSSSVTYSQLREQTKQEFQEKENKIIALIQDQEDQQMEINKVRTSIQHEINPIRRKNQAFQDSVGRALEDARTRIQKKQEILRLYLKLISGSLQSARESHSALCERVDRYEEKLDIIKNKVESKLNEEQHFYQEKESDPMRVPPYSQITRLPREDATHDSVNQI